MSTVKEQIRKRFPEHCQRICEIIHEQMPQRADWFLGRRPAYSMGLRSWFEWKATTEGHAYWRALHESDEAVR